MAYLLDENDTGLRWKPLLLIFLSALGVRIVVMLALQSWEFRDEWAFGYELSRLGRSLANGIGFILNEGEPPTAAFPPLYPLVIGALFYIFGSYTHAAAVSIFLFQSICAGIIAVLLVMVGTRLWNRKAGLSAGLIWVFYPTSIFYSVIHIWYCELAMMLLLCAVMIAITAQPPATLLRSMLFGALSGVIILTDPTFAIYLALLLLWMLFAQRARVAKLAGSLVVAGIALGAVVSPWAIHNWIYQGYPMLVKSNFGEAVFLGNHRLALGENTKAERMRAYSTVDPVELKYYQSQPEHVADRYFLNKALSWITENPLSFVDLTAERIGYFWILNTARAKRAWLRLTYSGPLLMLALYGLWVSRRRLWHLAPLWLFMLVQPLPYYITHVSAGRYSYPVEPFVVLLAAAAVAQLVGRLLAATLGAHGARKQVGSSEFGVGDS